MLRQAFGLLAWNNACIFENNGPGLPRCEAWPTGLPSSVTIASTSLVDDDTHNSSAVHTSDAVIGRISNGIPPCRARSYKAPYVMPGRIRLSFGGAAMTPS